MKSKTLLTLLLLVATTAFAQNSDQNSDANTTSETVDFSKPFSLNDAIQRQQAIEDQVTALRNKDAAAAQKILNTAKKLNGPNSAMGGHDGNGGDPRVAEFLDGASEFCNWMESNATVAFYADICSAELRQLNNSVNLSNQIARVFSTTKTFKDRLGNKQDAFTDMELRTVAINFDQWDDEDQIQHQKTAAVQMATLIGMKNSAVVAQTFLNEKDKTAFTAQDRCSMAVRNVTKALVGYAGMVASCNRLEKSEKAKEHKYYLDATSSIKLIKDEYDHELERCREECGSAAPICNTPTFVGTCEERQ